ncbi:MAG: hypothetical protein ABI686_05290 [Acidobacteriota bacterium]
MAKNASDVLIEGIMGWGVDVVCLYISSKETKLTVEKGLGFNLILISN